MDFSTNGGTGDDSLSPQSVGMWATRTVYFAKMKSVADVGGPIDDMGFQREVWEQSKEQARSLWDEARAEIGENFRQVDFILALAGKVFAWVRQAGEGS